MTEDEARERVEAIRRSAGDDEGAHGMEDELWCDVLTAIAGGHGASPGRLAAIALTTQDIEFHRWCA